MVLLTINFTNSPLLAQNTQLEQLQVGDKLEYQGVHWQVENYGTYKDSLGYQTQEWLLKYPNQNEHYLQKEYNPATPKKPVSWYFTKKISQPQVLLAGSTESSTKNIVPDAWQVMQDAKTPYPALKDFEREYFYDFQTRGTYTDKDGSYPRITWDYWDKARSWNLELEALPQNELNVYLAQEVKPESLKVQLKKNFNKTLDFPFFKTMLALAAVIIGTLMMIFGNRSTKNGSISIR